MYGYGYGYGQQQRFGGIPFISDALRINFNEKATVISEVAFDLIGDQTRTVQPDWCIVGDGAETLTFNAAVNGIKWYDEQQNLSAAIDISGTHIWTVPVDNVCQILMFSDALCTTQIGMLALQEQTGLTCYDVGITSVNNNYNATLSSDIRATTIFKYTWNNWSNQYGYNLPAAVYIPADSASLTNDVLGNALTYSGLVKFNSEVVDMPISTGTGTGVLAFADLTGITIISSEGTATPVKSGNNINIGSGTIWDLLLSDGTRIIQPLDGFDVSANGNHATPSNLTETFNNTNLYCFQKGWALLRHSTDALANADKKIPAKLDGTFITAAEITTLFSGWARVADYLPVVIGNVYGNNMIGRIDFNPNRTAQLGSDIPRIWGTFVGGATAVGDVITLPNNGSLSNARVSGYWSIGVKYTITATVTNYSGTGNIYLPYDGSSLAKLVTSNGIYTYIYIPSSTTCMVFGLTTNGATITVNSIQEIIEEPLIDIGFAALSGRNMLADDGNTLGFEDFFADTLKFSSIFNPENTYKWKAFDFIYNLLMYGNDYIRKSFLIYLTTDATSGLFNGMYNMGQYLTAKTVSQLTKIAKSGGFTDEWDMLQAIHLNSQTELCIDLLRGDPLFISGSNIATVQDWSLNRNNPTQAVGGSQPLLKKTATDIYANYASDYHDITSISLDTDFRVLINKKAGTSYIIGSDANNYISHNAIDLTVKIAGTALDFVALRTGLTGEDCLIEITREGSSVNAQAIKPDGTVIDGGLPHTNSGTLVIDLIGGYDSGNLANSDQRQLSIEKATAGNLTTLTDTQLKQFAKI